MDTATNPTRAAPPRAPSACPQQISFEVMGTTATIGLTGDPSLLERARTGLRELDLVWSRFRPASTVSRLNAAAAATRRPVSLDVDPQTALLLHRSVQAWRATAGLFDPTVLPSLERLGYDEDLQVVRERGARAPAPATRDEAGADRAAVPAAGMDGVWVDLLRHRVTLPAGFAFDPGAIGKGLAADLVCGDLVRHGAADVMVNLGGDLRVARGRGGGHQGGWRILLDLPGARPGRGFRLASGGAATSWTHARRWTVTDSQGRTVTHTHVLDPASGASVRPRRDTDLVAVTVVTGQAWLADAMATAALVAGAEDGTAMLRRARTPAVLVDATGRLRSLGAMSRWLTSDPDGR